MDQLYFKIFSAFSTPLGFDIMAGRHQNRSFPLPGILPSGQVHAFGNCTESDVLEEDAEVYELRSRGKEKIRRSTSRDRLDDIIVLTKDIQEGDTLNAIALQYCCTVSFNLILHNSVPFYFAPPLLSIEICILLVDVKFLNF